MTRYACKCGCGFDAFSNKLNVKLRFIETKFGEDFHISSACRCPEHNAKVGGSVTSSHLTGHAVDVHVKQGNRWWDFIKLCQDEKHTIPRIVIYDWGFHLDDHPDKKQRIITKGD